MAAILQILPNFHTGGVEQTTFLVAEELARQGFLSVVASSGGMLAEKLTKNVTHINLFLNTKNPIRIFINIKKIKNIIIENNIKIVHVRSRAPGWSAYFAAKTTGAHFITTYHGAYGQNFFKWFYNRVMSLGNPVIVASKFMQAHVGKYYPKAGCLEIPSGVDTAYYDPDSVNNSQNLTLHSLLGTDKSSKIVLLAGRFTRIKGHQILLDAANQSAYKQDLKIVFVGDSKNMPLAQELKANAAALGLDLAVYTDQSDLRPFFAIASVVVVPTTKPEAFGRVTVEAMSMGKIVIANDLGASAEVINNPDWIFPHENAQKLAEKIDQAFSLTNDQGKEIGTQNRLRACTHYNIKNLTDGHIEIYKRILKT